MSFNNEEYRDKLYKHLTSIELMNAYHSGEALKYMFDNDIEKVFEWDENDYQGVVMMIWKFENKYIYGNTSYGSCSGCDSWIDADIDLQKSQLKGLFDDLTIVDNIWEIDIGDYPHSEMLKDLIILMDTKGYKEQFLKFQLKCKHKREIDELFRENLRREKKEKELLLKKQQDELKYQEEENEKLNNLKELLVFLNKGHLLDDFFYEKLPAKIRLLESSMYLLSDIMKKKFIIVLNKNNIKVPGLN